MILKMPDLNMQSVETKQAKRDNSVLFSLKEFSANGLTVCVTGAGAGVDSAWEQKKLEARKLLLEAADSQKSAARCVSRLYAISKACWTLNFYIVDF